MEFLLRHRSGVIGEQWVVTYTIEFPNNELMVTEFFRGEREECERIKRASAGGDHDLIRTKRPWKPIVGPAHEWDDFLNS
jgi:hypothetical protein